MKFTLEASSLLQAPDYRGFLSTLYKNNKAINPKFSYAYMAKKCKFSSKSFIKEVIDGKKNLSLESSHKLINGLDFPSVWKKYFLCLVNHDEVELKRLRAKLSTKSYVLDGKDLFSHISWPIVYAALGDSNKGATLTEIIQRTRLPENVLVSTLEYLSSQNMVVKSGLRYKANSDTAFFENLGKSQFFKNFYLNAVSKLHENARRDFASEDALFYTMALSVDAKKMPQFRLELIELLDKFTSDAESNQGNRVAFLTCGFHLC